LVGRALWAEAAMSAGADRARVISETVTPRWRQLAAVE